MRDDGGKRRQLTFKSNYKLPRSTWPWGCLDVCVCVCLMYKIMRLKKAGEKPGNEAMWVLVIRTDVVVICVYVL